MKKGFGLTLLAICLSGMLSGCTVSLPRKQAAVGLPENIYITPPAQDFRGARVGLFVFDSPNVQQETVYIQPPNPGYGAAMALYQAFLKEAIFQQITMASNPAGLDRETLLKAAREKGLDLVVTGQVLYLFEGTSQLPSLVDEEIRIIEVATGQTLLYAEAREAVPPFIETDLILVLLQGQNAPSTMALMERNAQKFCSLWVTSQQ